MGQRFLPLLPPFAQGRAPGPFLFPVSFFCALVSKGEAAQCGRSVFLPIFRTLSLPLYFCQRSVGGNPSAAFQPAALPLTFVVHGVCRRFFYLVAIVYFSSWGIFCLLIVPFSFSTAMPFYPPHVLSYPPFLDNFRDRLTDQTSVHLLRCSCRS